MTIQVIPDLEKSNSLITKTSDSGKVSFANTTVERLEKIKKKQEW